jgi:hypothetical protein
MADDTTRTSKGVSLAKGPVAILGLIGVIFGILGLVLGGHGFAMHVPHGAVHGKKWLGIEVNGWSDLLFIAAGLALLLAAPLHWGAKGMSMLVALVLGAAAIVAVIRGDGVFGFFAADHRTELVWGAAAVVLLVLALLPRVGGGRGSEDREERQEPVVRRRRTIVRPTEPVQAVEPQRPTVVTRKSTNSQQPQQQVVDEPPRSAGAQTTTNTNLDKEIR